MLELLRTVRPDDFALLEDTPLDHPALTTVYDRLQGVRMVCGGDVERAWRREHDQPGAILERANLQDEPLLDEERERVKPHAEGAARRGVQMASMARREYVDIRRAQLDRPVLRPGLAGF